MNKFPLCVVIYLTNYCYLKCNHCFLKQLGMLNTEYLDVKIVKRLLKELKDNNVFLIAYTGGDPMMHPNIFEILKTTKDLGMLPLLGISGENITNTNAKEISNSGVKCVQIGLNGSNSKINDSYRKIGNFENVCESIKKLQSNNINVNLSFCLDKNNYYNLTSMLNFAKKNNIYKVKIEYWKCLNESNENELNSSEMIECEKVCMDYMQLNNKPDWIQYPKRSTNLNKIRNKAVIIMPNGDVKRNEIDLPMGNIKNEKLKEILMRGD